MSNIYIRLCRYTLGYTLGYTLAMFVVLQGTAVAQSPTLEQLRQTVQKRGVISGQFLQCTSQGNVKTSGYGHFTFAPKVKITLRFIKPRAYTVHFFSDGTQTKVSGGREQRSPSHSPLGRMMFSIIGMREAELNRRFEVEIEGSFAAFTISLKPKKRLAKLLESVSLTGSAGMLNSLRMVTVNQRKISLFLFAAGQAAEVVCE